MNKYNKYNSWVAFTVRGALLFVGLIFSLTVNATTNQYPAHLGDSPVSFDDIAEPDGEFVVSDRRAGELDWYQFRSSGTYEIEVNIPVNRYVGSLSEAIAAGTISSTAKIFIPAFDVDANTFPSFDCDGDNIPDSFQPEVDEVYFNGKLLGTLAGDNNLWKFNDTFTVPIDEVNFPAAPGEVAQNTIQIAIDVANKDVVMSGGGTGCRVWATSVDWVGIKFEAAKPVYLMTGLFGSPASLEGSGYVENLKTSLELYSKIIDHGAASVGICNPKKLTAIDSNANAYIAQIKEDGALIGNAEVHLIGHSLGGLDGRMMLKKLAAKNEFVNVSTMDGQPVKAPIKPVSLLTHSTPHKGTLVADYLPSILPLSAIVKDICELSVDTWKIANLALNQLNGAKLVTIGSDADQNGDAVMSPTELAGNQIPWNGLGNKLYSLLYNNDDLTIDYQVIPAFPAPYIVPVVTFVPGGPNPNDTMSTVSSSHGAPGIAKTITPVGKNHGTIIDNSVQNQAIGIGPGTLGWGDLR